jgi:hypothetical protein
LNNKMDVESQEIIIPEGVVLDTSFTDYEKKSVWKRLFKK